MGSELEGAKQQNLVVTPQNEPAITVDNIEVAQFVYLLLNNEKIREVIDTIGKKGVLLLGRFTEGRITILERLREKLRGLGYVPMVFNFDKPETKDFTETVRLLASLSKFVIVDITNPQSAPLELQAAVPDYMVPFVPILQKGENPFAMFVDLQNKYDWVLPVIAYPQSTGSLRCGGEDVRPAEAKFNQLLTRRTEQLRIKTSEPSVTSSWTAGGFPWGGRGMPGRVMDTPRPHVLVLEHATPPQGHARQARQSYEAPLADRAHSQVRSSARNGRSQRRQGGRNSCGGPVRARRGAAPAPAGARSWAEKRLWTRRKKLKLKVEIG